MNNRLFITAGGLSLAAILAFSVLALEAVSLSKPQGFPIQNNSGSFYWTKFAEASSIANSAQLGPNSTATIEAEGMGELVVAIQEGNLPDGFYDVAFSCDSQNINKTYSKAVEVLNGFGSAEIYLNLQDGRYANCTLQIDDLGAELPPMVITQGAGLGGREYLDRVIYLLNGAAEEYRMGNYSGARNLAIEAYNSNFELIERDIVENNSELKEKLEKEISEELLDMIQEERPASEIDVKVSDINVELSSVKAIITPEFPQATIVMSIILGLGMTAAIRTIYRKSLHND